MKLKLDAKKKPKAIKRKQNLNKQNEIEISIDLEEHEEGTAPFFKCPNCGSMVKRDLGYCEYCDATFDENGEITSNPAANKTRLFIKQKKAAIIVAAALVLGGTGINSGIDYMTQITVPSVEGMMAAEALDTLEEAGFEPEDVIFYCDQNLSESDIETGEYEVVDQSVDEGDKIHSDDTITLNCNDLYEERTEAMASLQYKSAADAIDTAEKYGYSYELLNIKKDEGFEEEFNKLSKAEKIDYFVYDITSIDNDDRKAVLTIDSNENINKEIDRLFTACVDKHVEDASPIADALDMDLVCLDYDNSTTTASPELVVTSVKDVDFTDRKVTITTDTEEHIEDLKIIPTLAKKIPYEGLKEKYITETAVGTYDKQETSDDDYDLEEGETAYYWTSDDGKYDVLKIICKAGKVSKVKKLNKEVYWTSSLPDFSADKDEYDAKIAAAAAAEEEKEEQVWIPRTGSCYHSNPNCSNMKDPTEVSISTAKRLGFRACKKCY